MKRNLLLFIALFLGVSVNAQVQTLVNEDFTSGFYGGPVFKAGLFNGNSALLSGGRGAWIINHTFAIGGGSYSTIYDFKPGKLSINDRPLYTELDYGGFEMEYINNDSRLIHWTIHTTLGGGTIKLMEHNPNITIESDKIFMFEPGFNIDFNVLNWFRIGVGLSYRSCFGLDLQSISYSDINGPSGQVVFKFGSF